MSDFIPRVRNSWGPPDRSFYWSDEITDDGVIVHVGGELDLAVRAPLECCLAAAMRSSADRILLDFAHVRFIDASCIGPIARAWFLMQSADRVLQITGLRELPERVFGICGLTPMVVPSAIASEYAGEHER